MSEAKVSFDLPARSTPQACAELGRATRYALNSLRIHPSGSGVWVTATDGRKLVAIHTNGESADGEPQLVPLSVLPKRTPAKGLHVERNGQWQAGKCFVPESETPEGRYPDCPRSLPSKRETGPDTLTLKLNATYLKQIADTIAPDSGEVALLMSLADGDTCKAGYDSTAVGAAVAVIPCADEIDGDAFGVIMPLGHGAESGKVSFDVQRWNDVRERYQQDWR